MQNEEVAAWGKAVLEEVLLRAALDISDSGQKITKAGFQMPFEITADTASGSLVVRCGRLGGADLKLDIAIPRGEGA